MSFHAHLAVSLHATFLRNRIVATIRSSKDPEIQKAASSISQNFIFDHPTLNELASAIAAIVSPSSAGAREVNTATQIEQMLAKYAQDLSRPIYPADKKTSKRPVVLLTGSTGNVGSHILVALLREAQVQKVYTLNRPSSSVHARQEAAFVERGLPVDLLSDTKLVQLAGDVTAENFGLESAIFEQVRRFGSFLKLEYSRHLQVKQEVTQVVHNAWRVDFNLSLSSFEKYVAGTRRLIDILGSLPRPAKLFFTSSVAAAYMWDTATGAVPEEVLKDPFIGSANGYGASKFVGENVRAYSPFHVTALADRLCASYLARLQRTAYSAPRCASGRSAARRTPVLGARVNGSLSSSSRASPWAFCLTSMA